MAEHKYIERGSLLQKAKLLQGKLFAVPLIIDAIEYAPAVDVVEVVRCKDCEYGKADYGWDGKITTPFQYHCEYEDTWNRPDHYCGYGKKKEGNYQ